MHTGGEKYFDAEYQPLRCDRSKTNSRETEVVCKGKLIPSSINLCKTDAVCGSHHADG